MKRRRRTEVRRSCREPEEVQWAAGKAREEWEEATVEVQRTLLSPHSPTPLCHACQHHHDAYTTCAIPPPLFPHTYLGLQWPAFHQQRPPLHTMHRIWLRRVLPSPR